jgi:hypothetical protein
VEIVGLHFIQPNLRTGRMPGLTSQSASPFVTPP